MGAAGPRHRARNTRFSRAWIAQADTLVNGMNGIDAGRIEEAVEASSLWKTLVSFERVGSTNDVAKDRAVEGAPGGTVVVADEQTAGRGRLERQWLAPPRTSLLCSVLLRPDIQPAQANRLTMVCSMAAADAIEQLTGLAVALKWPNDLLVRSQISGGPAPEWRKLAGILTELVLSNAPPPAVVVGIGINVNVTRSQLPRLAPDATSVLAETGRHLDRAELLVAFLNLTEKRYDRLQRGEDPVEEWSQRLENLSRRVRVATAEGIFEGVAEAVDDDGALLLRTPSGSLKRLLAGDVTLLAE